MEPISPVLDRLAAQAVLPVLRSASALAAVSAVEALGTAGARVVELTTSTPDWPRALADLDGSGTAVGLGTVASREQAERAVELGAAFLVTPFPVPDVAAWAAEQGVLLIAGGLTPGELAAATGAGVAKVFPAHVGGPAYLRSLAPVLPGLRLVPTGGISWADVDDYLAAGALAVGIGSGLDLPPAALAEAFDRVRRA